MISIRLPFPTSLLLLLLVSGGVPLAGPSGTHPPATVGPSGSSSEAHHHDAPHGGIVTRVADRHFELVFDDRHAVLTLHSLDHASRSRPIPARSLAARVRSPEIPFGGSLELELEPLPVDGDPRGTASRFVGLHPELQGLETFEMTVSAGLDDLPEGFTFAISKDAFAEIFVCPMGCESGRAYREPGHCPVCKMRLASHLESHGDHTPRHGGVLFMADDGWHHLEGVLPSRREFRVYLFNEFTQPLTAGPSLEGIDGHVVVRQTGRGPGPPVPASPIDLSVADGFLRAALPEGLALPVELEVRLRFAGRENADAFRFTFESASSMRR